MSYLGSKAASGLYKAIISLMPPHDTYIEAFLGSGVVLKNKPLSKRTLAFDLDTAMLDENNYDGSVELFNTDFLSSIVNFDFSGKNVLIYADPPYLHSTRGKARYKFDYTTQQHIELLSVLKNIPAKIIISGYPSKLYDEMLQGWQSIELQAMTRGGVRTEKLWFNYKPDACFCSTFAGKNFTDRQRIKRKTERWLQSYLSMSAGEQLSILSALLISHSHK